MSIKVRVVVHHFWKHTSVTLKKTHHWFLDKTQSFVKQFCSRKTSVRLVNGPLMLLQKWSTSNACLDSEVVYHKTQPLRFCLCGLCGSFIFLPSCQQGGHWVTLLQMHKTSKKLFYTPSGNNRWLPQGTVQNRSPPRNVEKTYLQLNNHQTAEKYAVRKLFWRNFYVSTACQIMDALTVVGYLTLAFIGYKLFFRILRIPRISNLDSRYILITGCDSGFGNATAKRLDSLGCHVIAACFTKEGQTELESCCSKRLSTLHLDVRSQESIQQAYNRITEKVLPQGLGKHTLTFSFTQHKRYRF